MGIRESMAAPMGATLQGATLQVVRGHWLLVACAVLYLFWWAVFFRPGAHVEGVLRGIAIVSILLAAVCGIAGLALAGSALPRLGGGSGSGSGSGAVAAGSSMAPGGGAVSGGGAVAGSGTVPGGGTAFGGDAAGLAGLAGVPLWGFAVVGVVVYVALAAVTAGLLHRPITTELLLLVLWATFEVAVIARIGGAGAVSQTAAVALLVLVAVLFVGSMVCYALYYRLPAWPAFLAGCAPLVAVGVEAVAVAVLVLVAP